MMTSKTQTQDDMKFNPFSMELDKVIYTTNSQLEIWTDCIIGGEEANKAYNLSIYLNIKGDLDIDKFKSSINTLIGRHECLRSAFSPDGRFMCIFKNTNASLLYRDISELTEKQKLTERETLIKEEVDFLFDLVYGPLFRVKIVKINVSDFLVTITMHHIIGDGLSFDIILEELGTIYSAYVIDQVPNLPKAENFSEFSEKMNLLIESNEYKQIEDFWLDMYKDSVPTLELPIDNKRPNIRTYKSQRLDFPIDESIINSLKHVGLSAKSSLVTTLLSAFEIFLCKQTGQNDVVVGFPASGNILFDMRQMIGDCVNLLPLRSKIESNISFLDYLKNRNSHLFDAYEHQSLGFGQLLKNINIARDPSRVPLVPVILTVDLNRDIESEFSFTGLSHEFFINPREYATFEMQLHAFRAKNGPIFQWSYNSNLFNQETIKQMMVSFEEILNKIISNPNCQLSDLINGDYTEKYELLNNTKLAYPDATILDLIHKQSENTPNNIAVEFKGIKTTYLELMKKVNQFSQFLLAQGIQKGDIIAVSLPRNSELVISLLAIMQCGATYLPLDPEYPSSRLEYMLSDSGAKSVLANKSAVPSFAKSTKIIFVEDALSPKYVIPQSPFFNRANQEDAAYVLYTSGSTGKPKGVIVTHKNLCNFICSMAVEPGISISDRLLSITTISFDIAGLELYLPLSNGATLIIADEETSRDGRLLLDLIKNENISFLQATPTTWQMLIDSGWSDSFSIKALCGGEALSFDLAKEMVMKCDSVWNMYGPTETTIWSSVKQIKSTDLIITIGHPIANTQIYILDENGLLAAPGKKGEIAIGGDGLSKGYLNNPELTAEKFIQAQFLNPDSQILYKTGDAGKLLSNNEIECLGRIDQQLKIRGHRIEPGEIEQALLSIDGIKQAIVLANDNFLLAHIVPNESIDIAKTQIPQWREILTNELPAHLIPHDFNIITRFPTTSNGKIDRKALLEFKSNQNIEYNGPRTEEEMLVASIWKEALNLEKIDIYSNFFELGGHSIVAVKVMLKLEQKTGIRLPLSTLFEHSTIEKIAKLFSTTKDKFSDCIVPLKSKGTKVPIFIIHGAGLNVLNFVNLSKHFDPEQPVYGIQGIGPNGYDNWYDSIESMAAHYVDSIIKINPKGPYALAGFSFGGIVAFEMTRQLKEQGKQVSLTAMLDAHVDPAYFYKSIRQKTMIRYLNRNRKRFEYFIQMVTSWKLFKLRVSIKTDFILEKYFKVKKVVSEQDTFALKQFEEADRMVMKIINRYHLKPQNFEIDLFRSKEDDTYTVDPEYLGWKKAALKGVTIHNVPGNHLDIVAPPNDKFLARLLQDMLDQRHYSSK